MITTEFPVALFVRVTLLEVDATVAVEAGIVVLIADSSPVVETPVVQPALTVVLLLGFQKLALSPILQ